MAGAVSHAAPHPPLLRSCIRDAKEVLVHRPNEDWALCTCLGGSLVCIAFHAALADTLWHTVRVLLRPGKASLAPVRWPVETLLSLNGTPAAITVSHRPFQSA